MEKVTNPEGMGSLDESGQVNGCRGYFRRQKGHVSLAVLHRQLGNVLVVVEVVE